MKKGEHYIVTSEAGSRHPVGTEVVIVHINQSLTDSKPILARSREGRTEYWYAEDELAKEIDGIKI
jgi:hypothetical protein